jgi:hypothetical protein
MGTGSSLGPLKVVVKARQMQHNKVKVINLFMI